MKYKIGDIIIYPEGDIWEYAGYNTRYPDNHAVKYIKGGEGNIWLEGQYCSDPNCFRNSKLYTPKEKKSNKPNWF